MINRNIIYDKYKTYLIYYETKTVSDYIIKDKIKLYYIDKSEKFAYDLKYEIDKIQVISLSEERLKNILKYLNQDFISIKLETKTKYNHNVKYYLKNHFTLLKNEKLKKVVIKGGTIPIKYIPKKLP